MSAPGGVYLVWGVSAPGGGSAPEVSALGGVPGQVFPPTVNRMRNRCKNITFPQTSFAGSKNTQVLHVKITPMRNVR